MIGFKMNGAYLLAMCGLLASGCGDAGDNAIDRRMDCNSICDRYKECFDSDYNEKSCYDNCTSEADKDTDFENKVDACALCIEDASCTEAFTCATKCVGIVP